MRPKTLDTHITYPFRDGSTRTFRGKKGYRLANSWHDALEQARRECERRDEAFRMDRILGNR